MACLYGTSINHPDLSRKREKSLLRKWGLYYVLKPKELFEVSSLNTFKIHLLFVFAKMLEVAGLASGLQPTLEYGFSVLCLVTPLDYDYTLPHAKCVSRDACSFKKHLPVWFLRWAPGLALFQTLIRHFTETSWSIHCLFSFVSVLGIECRGSFMQGKNCLPLSCILSPHNKCVCNKCTWV